MKLAAGLFALMLGIAAVSFFAWRAAPVPPPCVDKDVASALAPDGKSLAEVFTKQCGDNLATHVSLRRADKPVGMRSDVVIVAGGAPVKLLWVDSAQLAVESPARVLVAESGWHSVRVRVENK